MGHSWTLFGIPFLQIFSSRYLGVLGDVFCLSVIVAYTGPQQIQLVYCSRNTYNVIEQILLEGNLTYIVTLSVRVHQGSRFF